ncbi:hypothetical protein NP493_647g00000 [Ridgeia piscesae]|uniref:Non-structural maintenance of chromosomes element 1 homolog n=1 Tax=Ridgeia piscesae TaxID=27915 RepID=A0AAD9KS73_RIDPI|nr:hypothetical protein NP493_647g00000 [Ridgeia piscesae]
MALRDSHRLFLQSFMSRGILPSKEVRQLYQQACERFGEASDLGRLAEFVNRINIKISPLHLQIKKGINEVTAAQYYGLVNTAESDITRLSSTYTVNELEFYKKIIESIVDSDDGVMSSTDALNLTSQLEKKMLKKDAEDLISKFERDNWLELNPKGEIALSTRAILELDQYIQNQYPNLAVKCNMCHRLCLQGETCSRCDVKLHFSCAERYFDKQEKHHCPSSACNAPWPQDSRRPCRPSDPSAASTASNSEENLTNHTTRSKSRR